MPSSKHSRRAIGIAVLTSIAGCFGAQNGTAPPETNTTPPTETASNNSTGDTTASDTEPMPDPTPVSPVNTTSGIADGPNPLASSNQPIAARLNDAGTELTLSGVTRVPTPCHELSVTRVAVASEQLTIELDSADTSAANVACTQQVALAMYTITLSTDDVDPEAIDDVVISAPITETTTYDFPRVAAGMSSGETQATQ